VFIRHPFIRQIEWLRMSTEPTIQPTRRPRSAPWATRRADVDGVGIAYVETGSGDPIVLLHGNPTSSYLWRNVLPWIDGLGRCVAPDLVGMGSSDALASGSQYTFAEHAAMLANTLRVLGADKRVTLVLHDWGSVLGFDWARHNPERLKGIAYMEAIVVPLRRTDFPDGGEFLDRVRGPEGERLVLQDNVFIEGFLPAGVLRHLEPEELETYRHPWREAGERRRPMLSWARHVPLDGEPATMVEVVEANRDWLARSPVPKLLISATPGQFLTGRALEQCRTWPNQREVAVVGRHFVQEDAPDEIGRAIGHWLTGLS
jgi:haloalkane dehalogenase